MCYFLRFAKEKSHLVEFVEQGRIFVNPVSFFRDCESSNIGQKDNFELAMSCHQPDGASLLLAGRNFSFAKEYHMMPLEPEYTHIYCFGTVTNTHIKKTGRFFDDKLWGEFGQYLVLIHDPSELINRMEQVLSRRHLKFQYGPVQYYNPESYEGNVGAFLKRNSYAHQQEFRLAISMLNFKFPITDLYLGDLSDIATGPTHKDDVRVIRSE